MITPTKTILSATLVSAIAVLSGCSADMGGAGRDAATQRIDSIQARVDAEGSRLAHLQDTGRPSNMSVRDGVYLGRDGFRTGHGDPLPRRLEKADAITLKMGDEISLGDLVPILQRATGLRIDIRDLDTIAGASGQRDGGNGGSGADSAGGLIGSGGGDGIVQLWDARASLDKGVVDAADNTVFATNQSLGMNDIANYPLYPGFHSLPMIDVSMTKSVWDELPDDLQEILTASVKQFSFNHIFSVRQLDAAAVEKARENPEIEIINWSGDERAKFRRIAQEEWQNWAPKTEMTQRYYDAVTTYLQGRNLL